MTFADAGATDNATAAADAAMRQKTVVRKRRMRTPVFSRRSPLCIARRWCAKLQRREQDQPKPDKPPKQWCRGLPLRAVERQHLDGVAAQHLVGHVIRQPG